MVQDVILNSFANLSLCRIAWGSVAEWFAAIGTVGALGLTWRTLSLQKAQLEAQLVEISKNVEIQDQISSHQAAANELQKSNLERQQVLYEAQEEERQLGPVRVAWGDAAEIGLSLWTALDEIEDLPTSSETHDYQKTINQLLAFADIFGDDHLKEYATFLCIAVWQPLNEAVAARASYITNGNIDEAAPGNQARLKPENIDGVPELLAGISRRHAELSDLYRFAYKKTIDLDQEWPLGNHREALAADGISWVMFE